MTKGKRLRLALLASAILVATNAVAESPYFAPGVISRVPVGKERTKGNTIRTETECVQRRGEWFSGEGYSYCVLPYADAGKLCRNSKDCVGHCIMPLDKKALDGAELPPGHGLCQLNDVVDDCGRYHFENGKVKIFKCD
ncbi:MAG: hypothetical protein WBK19_14745 [Azonexus sp.]